LTLRGAIEFVRRLIEQCDRERFLRAAANICVRSKCDLEHGTRAAAPRASVAADRVEQLRRVVVAPFTDRYLRGRKRDFAPVRECLVCRSEMRLRIAQHSELPEENSRIAA